VDPDAARPGPATAVTTSREEAPDRAVVVRSPGAEDPAVEPVWPDAAWAVGEQSTATAVARIANPSATPERSRAALEPRAGAAEGCAERRTLTWFPPTRLWTRLISPADEPG